MDPLAIDTDFSIVRLTRRPGKLDRDYIFPIEREVTLDASATPGPERKPRHVAVLHQVAVQLVRVDDRQHGRIANRQPADLARRRQIPLHQCGRHEQQVGQIVKAARRVVGRQHDRNIQFLRQMVEGQQIAHGVLVLGAAEPVKRRATTGVRSDGGSAVERTLQPPRDGVDRGVVRARPAGWGHRADTQFPYDRFPRVRVRADLGEVEGVQRKPSGAQLRHHRRRCGSAAIDHLCVVTRDAILVEDPLHRGIGHRCRRRRRHAGRGLPRCGSHANT